MVARIRLDILVNQSGDLGFCSKSTGDPLEGFMEVVRYDGQFQATPAAVGWSERASSRHQEKWKNSGVTQASQDWSA